MEAPLWPNFVASTTLSLLPWSATPMKVSESPGSAPSKKVMPWSMAAWMTAVDPSCVAVAVRGREKLLHPIPTAGITRSLVPSVRSSIPLPYGRRRILGVRLPGVEVQLQNGQPEPAAELLPDLRHVPHDAEPLPLVQRDGRVVLRLDHGHHAVQPLRAGPLDERPEQRPANPAAVHRGVHVQGVLHREPVPGLGPPRTVGGEAAHRAVDLGHQHRVPDGGAGAPPGEADRLA